MLCIAWVTPEGLYAQSAVPAWKRWEQTLTSANGYLNPYRNLLLHVSWACVANCEAAKERLSELPRFGFWDGGNTFKIRAKFPQPPAGVTSTTWRWSSAAHESGGGVS